MGQEEFALFDQNIGLQTRPKLIQNDGLSYKSHPCVPETQGCDLYTRGYIYIYTGWGGVGWSGAGRGVGSEVLGTTCAHIDPFFRCHLIGTPLFRLPGVVFTWCS